MKNSIFNTSFDLAITNPPFGTKCMFDKNYIPQEHVDVLMPYTGKKKEPAKLDAELFLSIASIKNADVSCLLLPESMFSSSSYQTFRTTVMSNNGLSQVVSFPSDIFHGATKIKTSMLMIEKDIIMDKDTSVLMAIIDKEDKTYKYEEIISSTINAFAGHVEYDKATINQAYKSHESTTQKTSHLVSSAIRILNKIYNADYYCKKEVLELYVCYALQKEGIDVMEERIEKKLQKENLIDLLDQLHMYHKEIMRTEPQDVLGIFLMGGERGKKGYAGNSYSGQFFTEKEVCLTMAEMSFIKLMSMSKNRNRDDAFRIVEPSAGSGAMLLSFADVVKKSGYYVSDVMDITAVELNRGTSLMLLLQMKLANLNGRVVHGNSITGDVFEEWIIKSDEDLDAIEEDYLAEQKESQEDLNIIDADEKDISAISELIGSLDSLVIMPENMEDFKEEDVIIIDSKEELANFKDTVINVLDVKPIKKPTEEKKKKYNYNEEVTLMDFMAS